MKSVLYESVVIYRAENWGMKRKLKASSMLMENKSLGRVCAVTFRVRVRNKTVKRKVFAKQTME